MAMTNYSDRKKYQLGYGNESPSPALKRHLSEWIHAYDDGRINNPPHGAGYDPDDRKPVKRHMYMDPDFGPDQLKDIEEN